MICRGGLLGLLEMMTEHYYRKALICYIIWSETMRKTTIINSCQAGLVNVNIGNDSARYYTVNVQNKKSIMSLCVLKILPLIRENGVFGVKNM